MSENEKDKEMKKTSEAESYEEYEGEAIQDLEGSEGTSESKTCLALDVCGSPDNVQSSDIDQQIGDDASEGSYEERRRLLLREKWLNVTGKRPRNIPVLRKPFEVGAHRYIFFGDKRPEEVERNIRRKLLIAARKIESKNLFFGKIKNEIRLPALFSGLSCIRFDPTAETMTYSNRKGGVEIREATGGEVLMELKTKEQEEGMAVRMVRYFPGDPQRIYVVGHTGSVQVFKADTGEKIGAGEPLGSTYNMDFSPDGNFLVTGGKEGKIHVIDPHSLQVTSKRGWPNKDEPVQANVYDEYHRMRVYGMKCHPTEMNLFASGGWDSTVKIWDVRVQGAIRSINGPVLYGDGLDIKENVILTATWRAENSLNMWDFLSGKFIKNIPIKCQSTKFEGEFLYTCRFFQDFDPSGRVNSDMVAVGGSGFFDVLVINTKTDRIEQYFPSFKPILCLDINGQLLAYGGTESMIRIAEVEGRKPIGTRTVV